ncbi:MAG: dihydroorotase family protein [Candidatus Aenigmarchaeota archaeon]|nr:dihydroorotase family protein [Candidatus Aenigmarchaeota archaeon]
MTYDLIVEGKIVDPIDGVEETRVGIIGDRIAKIGASLSGRNVLAVPDSYVFPGFIDPHVHYREPGAEHKEDFYTGTRASCHGGCTTALDMPNNNPPAVTRNAMQKKIEAAKAKGIIDVKFYAGVHPKHLNELKPMERLPEVIGYKVFLSDTFGIEDAGIGYLEEAMKAITGTGKTGTGKRGTEKPVSFHCETPRINEMASSKYDPADKLYHCYARPQLSEILAIPYVLLLSSRIPVHIAHLSTADGLEFITQYKNSGADVSCEVTSHHLLYNMNEMLRLGSYAKMNPPLRPESDRRAVWSGLKDKVDMLATDHAPHTKEEKDSPNPPSGVPGADNYSNIASMLIEAFGPARTAQLTSYNAARRFGMHDRGRMQEGMLADIVVMEMKECWPNRLYTKCGWSPYEGMRFPGRATHTIYRGKIIMEDGELR